METTLYHDERSGAVENSNPVNRMKRTMTLDFNGPAGLSKKQKIQTALLQSPDLNMLKLASPELEKMIIQANGMVTTTPTPTQILFPKFVTEEQEAYAEGFVAALAQLHSGMPNGSEGVGLNLSNLSNLSNVPSNVTADAAKQLFTTTTSLPGGLVNTGAIPTSASKTGIQQSVSPLLVKVKEEPQTVPCGLNSPPLSPINMANQEVIKLERKRARNRVAARKCRTRKLERIARLEDKVADLKGQNTDLSTQASKLRDEVCRLKQTIIDHVNSGCQVMMTENIAF